ncbi:RNA 2',3'-cyclic phosphodiesterase [Catenuloplanes atrovinosus]|uniref:RNA 2',3'-cyclic phosphodiesterase n=1 Tax=Catenuloplanes atrovinosus TaxID=137266 RepID=A0AAE3YTK0_9ACTN|nr:RNA 2',3'-cyclic phosphodiesterase [Catenuloplanes atrovinosus]MDR7279619.1 2'-5' RNA ligase [Catenuloplanes atrovinosus]
MRLFAGIYPPEEACAHLAAHVSGLHISTARVNTRLAPRAQWHVTLVFLGEVPDDRLTDVDAAFRQATPSAGTPPARLRIAGGGRFGRGRFTILWAGLTGDVDRLQSSARAIRHALKRSRLPFDDRPFRPHLTLARPGDRIDAAQVEQDRAALDAYSGPEWPATSLRLMRSQLGPSPVYTELGRYPI